MASIPSVSQRMNNRNSSIDGLNVHGLAKVTSKTLERLAPFCLLRPTGLVQDVALMNKVVDKIKSFINGIDLSMLATQMVLKLANEAIGLSEINVPGQEWNIVPRRADEGLGRLAGLAAMGDGYAQRMSKIFTDVRQDLYRIAAMTKEKRNVMVIIPLDPEQLEANHTLTKSLRDVGLDLAANVNLLVDFAHHASSLMKWWSFVKQELEASATAAALTSDPNVQPTSPTSPGAMALPPALDADIWKRVQADYHSYFRTIREVQARYPNLMAASNEAWKVSAPAISLTPSSESEESNPAPNATSATKPEQNQNQKQSPTTPTSPSTYYDARSRPISMAVDDDVDEKGGKSDDKTGKKKRGISLLSPSKSFSSRKNSRSSSGSGSVSSNTPDLTTDQKLSMKKMRAFLFTRTVPRPQVRGLFPKSMRMSLSARSRSSAAGPSEDDQEQGKGKGKEKAANGDALGSEKLGPKVSFMNLNLQAEIEEKQVEHEKEKEKENENEIVSTPSRSISHSRTRSPSPASVRSRDSRSLLNVERDKGAVEAGTRATDADAGVKAPGKDADTGADMNPEAGQLIDEQTAAKSRSWFAIFRFADTLVKAGMKRLCGTCLGYD
ncbi:hypothetical protein APHAL10511_000400 [Amanita phalloides]|nr:hypothetical protein APHAL10511_000400 [Amanita phalloides]